MLCTILIKYLTNKNKELVYGKNLVALKSCSALKRTVIIMFFRTSLSREMPERSPELIRLPFEKTPVI